MGNNTDHLAAALLVRTTASALSLSLSLSLVAAVSMCLCTYAVQELLQCSLLTSSWLCNGTCVFTSRKDCISHLGAQYQRHLAQLPLLCASSYGFARLGPIL